MNGPLEGGTMGRKMGKTMAEKKFGALVDEHRLALVVGYLIHTGTAFFCIPGDEEDWLVTVNKDDGEELAAIDRETRTDTNWVTR
jgi:hypothetical protein